MKSIHKEQQQQQQQQQQQKRMKSIQMKKSIQMEICPRIKSILTKSIRMKTV